jgi:hypothetical protein
MSSVEEILANSRALRKTAPLKAAAKAEFKKLDDIRYPRITRVYCVLAPVGYEWRQITIDIYTDSPKVHREFDEPFTLIKHGHPVGRYACFAPDMCHVLGYKPVGNEAPSFLKLWRDKWG